MLIAFLLAREKRGALKGKNSRHSEELVMAMDVKNMSADQVKAALDSLFEPIPSSTPKPEEKGKVSAKGGDNYKAPDSRLVDILSGGSTRNASKTTFSDLSKSGVDFHGTKLATHSDEPYNTGMMKTAQRGKALRYGKVGEHSPTVPVNSLAHVKATGPKVQDRTHQPKFSIGPSGLQGAGFDGTNFPTRGLGLFLLDLDAQYRPSEK